MEYAALALALVALIVALGARARAAASQRDLESGRDDVRRRVANAVEEMQRAHDVTRRHLAAVAAGESVDRDMILEGRTWRDVSVREAVEMVARGEVRVLDVRTRSEVAAGVIPGALVVPIDELEARASEVTRAGKPWLVVCAAGARSSAACEFLASKGLEGLCNLDGGMNSWSGPRAPAG